MMIYDDIVLRDAAHVMSGMKSLINYVSSAAVPSHLYLRTS